MSQTTPGHAPPIEAYAPPVRAAFMRKVYANLMLGIAAFIGLEVFLFTSGLAATIYEFVASTTWLLILGGFMVVSWLSRTLAYKATTPASQYGGFALLVAANALLFVAPLYIAANVPELDGTIATAAWISIGAFAGLSGIAITTGKDFSFLRGLLMWAGVLALVAIVGAVIFGFELGTWFSVAMIGVAGGAILYDTQKIYRNFPPGAEVPAAMELFSSLTLLFWYVLRLLTRR